MADYDRRGGYNVLHPVVQVAEGAVSPVLVESISVVPIRPEAGETYHDARFAPEGEKHALSALGLGKIAAAAGVRWIESGFVEERDRRPDGHLYIRVRATGAVRQPNGEPYLISAHKEIDTEDLAEQYAEEDRRKIARGWNKDRKTGRVIFSEKDIPDRTRQRIMQVREHLLSLAESKAQNRVIRKLLSLKQVYTTAELSRPFVVPRLLFRPDLLDPAQAELVQLQGRRASEEIYGSPSALPAGQASTGSGAGAESVPSPAGSEVEPAAATTQRHPGAAGTPGAKGEVAAGPSGPPSASGPSGPDAGPSPPQGEDLAPDTGPEQPSPEYIPGVDGPPEPPRPKADPLIEEGPHRGKHWSEIAAEHPDYLRAIVNEARAKGRRELAQAWLDFVSPRLMG